MSSRRSTIRHRRPPVRPGDGPFQAGQQVGPRYTILKLLGIGGMGAVYQAFDHELGVAVAIKVIRPGAQSDATVAKELETRFKRELVLARQVTHKYVVRIHDLGEIDGIKYLTMPFVEGETLAQVLRKQETLPLARVIKISQQIAQGLAAAHDKGVVHRDLKPENIMIETVSEDPVPNSGDALIMDFGIARSVEHGATQTAAGSVIGTLEYMAPEQAQGKQVDQRADQYALGLIIYDMLVGRVRTANRDNPMTELLARMSAAPPPPRSIKAEIPPSAQRHRRPAARTGIRTSASRRRTIWWRRSSGWRRTDRLRSDIHEVIVHDAPARSKLAMARGLSSSWSGPRRAFCCRAARRPVSAAHDPISVLIGDFENRTGDPMFDGVVEQALSLGIEGASFINSFSRRDAMRAAEAIKPGSKLDEQTSRLVAFRENLGLAVVGAIEPKGSGYHITIKGVGAGPDGEVKFTLEDDAAEQGRRAANRRRAGGAGAHGARRHGGAGGLRCVHRGQSRSRARIRERTGAVCGGQAGGGDSGVPCGDQARPGLWPRLFECRDGGVEPRAARRRRTVLQQCAREDRSHDRSREVPHARPVPICSRATRRRRSRSSPRSSRSIRRMSLA